MKSDSELDSLGRKTKHEHEWSEWHNLVSEVWPDAKGDEFLTIVSKSEVKIRVCKKCKQAQFDII